jgi:predicted mannosyl-3-phosphoglycerate phosphatase (HAD superfamily)
MFIRVYSSSADEGTTQCQLPADAIAMLTAWGFRLVLVSGSPVDDIVAIQHQLDLVEPFICNGGAALHVPSHYFESPKTSHVTASNDWEVFSFNPPDRAAGVNLVRDLFLADGWSDVLTIGIGCDGDDYRVLSAVDIPIVVRDASKDQSMLLRHIPAAYLTTATGTEGWTEALIGS